MEQIFFKRVYQILLTLSLSVLVVARSSGWRPTLNEIENLTSHAPWLCLFQKWTDWDCPGCGMTRSMVAFFLGAWELSFYFHPMGPFLGLILIVVYLDSLRSDGPLNLQKWFPQRGSFSFLLVLLAWGVLRNL